MKSVSDVVFIFIVSLGSFAIGGWSVEHMANRMSNLKQTHELKLLFYENVYVYKDKQHGSN